jgi:hypothetical protein
MRALFGCALMLVGMLIPQMRDLKEKKNDLQAQLEDDIN